MGFLSKAFESIQTTDQRGDSKKTLLKIGGKRPGKKCGGSYISAAFACKEHKSKDGKLTDKGKESARELADKVRSLRGKMGLIREGDEGYKAARAKTEWAPRPGETRLATQTKALSKSTMSLRDKREAMRRKFDPDATGTRAETIKRSEEIRAIVSLGGRKNEEMEFLDKEDMGSVEQRRVKAIQAVNGIKSRAINRETTPAPIERTKPGAKKASMQSLKPWGQRSVD